MSAFETQWPGMVLLQTTGFTRGSAKFPNESPVRRVRLTPYLIDRLPVTNAQFARFVTEGGYRAPRFWTETGWRFAKDRGLQAPNYWNDPHWNAPDMPVTGISWWEVCAYAAFVGKTLPTEAQWEYAAGFGERTYPWGEASPTHEHANFAPDCEPDELRRRGTPVAGLALNIAASGCRDMAGNVGEWCLDNASSNYEWDCGAPDPLCSRHARKKLTSCAAARDFTIKTRCAAQVETTTRPHFETTSRAFAALFGRWRLPHDQNRYIDPPNALP